MFIHSILDEQINTEPTASKCYSHAYVTELFKMYVYWSVCQDLNEHLQNPKNLSLMLL